MADHEAILASLKDAAEERCISLDAAQRIGKSHSCSLRSVEHAALNNTILPLRYQRNGLSCEQQLTLFNSSVSVIGCGGLGGRVAELLARIGIGHLLLTDPDVFSESNLNRQLFCTTKTLGCSKVETAATALIQINPALKITCRNSVFDKHCIEHADIAVDGLDSVSARKELAHLCREHSIPMVHGSVKKWYGQVGIDSADSPLITGLYPQSRTDYPPPKVLAMTVSLIASLQVAETCKLLLGSGTTLLNGWLQCDLLQADYEQISLPRQKTS